VTFDGVPARLLSAQSHEIVFIVPFGVARSASTTVQAQSDGSASNAIFSTAPSSIEMLTAVSADGSINSSGHPAAPD
jgi:uncharacterized protein (TIGR03437 family)